jgi:hypothetical protein
MTGWIVCGTTASLLCSVGRAGYPDSSSVVYREVKRGMYRVVTQVLRRQAFEEGEHWHNASMVGAMSQTDITE